jgi:RNA polymerase sigma-70 factor (ECF subfamily)
MPVQPEEAIVSLFRRLSETPDQTALWQLHSCYYHRLYAYILSIVHQKEAAEEIANDVFVDIWQKRHLLANVARPEMYLFVCAKNRALRYSRKKQPVHESLDATAGLECKLAMDPYELIISSEMLNQLNQTIAALPPKCRMIFRLVKENHLKYREVAELLGISEKTVESQMAIALRRLSSSVLFKLA